ncbi:MAG: hypothetical protein WBA76_04120 [Phormidesmis sp.]
MSSHVKLVDYIAQTFAIAHREPTDQLTQALTKAEFDCSVLMQTVSAEVLTG